MLVYYPPCKRPGGGRGVLREVCTTIRIPPPKGSNAEPLAAELCREKCVRPAAVYPGGPLNYRLVATRPGGPLNNNNDRNGYV